jgi:glucose/arabinose dehydrogenase
MPGMEQPVIYWTPSIAPSGMAFYTGARIPVWHGDLFVGALNITTDATDGRILRLGPP